MIEALENLINAVEGNNGDPACEYYQLHAIEAAKEALKKGKDMLHAIEDLSSTALSVSDLLPPLENGQLLAAIRAMDKAYQAPGYPGQLHTFSHLVSEGIRMGKRKPLTPKEKASLRAAALYIVGLLNDEPIDPADVARAA